MRQAILFFHFVIWLFTSTSYNIKPLKNYFSYFTSITKIQQDSTDRDTIKTGQKQRTNAANKSDKPEVNYLERTISILASIATVMSTIIAVQQSRKVNILKKQKRRLTWDDVEIGINQLFKKIEAKFKPDVVLCLSERGAAVVTIGLSVVRRDLPIIIALWQMDDQSILSAHNEDFIEFTSRNRKFYIPKYILHFSDKNILVVDDFVFSGQAIATACNILIENGVPKNNIKCATLVTTVVAKSVLKNIQDDFFFFYEFSDNDFYFPWGKAE